MASPRTSTTCPNLERLILWSNMIGHFPLAQPIGRLCRAWTCSTTKCRWTSRSGCGNCCPTPRCISANPADAGSTIDPPPRGHHRGGERRQEHPGPPPLRRPRLASRPGGGPDRRRRHGRPNDAGRPPAAARANPQRPRRATGHPLRHRPHRARPLGRGRCGTTPSRAWRPPNHVDLFLLCDTLPDWEPDPLRSLPDGRTVRHSKPSMSRRWTAAAGPGPACRWPRSPSGSNGPAKPSPMHHEHDRDHRAGHPGRTLDRRPRRAAQPRLHVGLPARLDPLVFLPAALGAGLLAWLCWRRNILAEAALQLFYVAFAGYGAWLSSGAQDWTPQAEPLSWHLTAIALTAAGHPRHGMGPGGGPTARCP